MTYVVVSYVRLVVVKEHRRRNVDLIQDAPFDPRTQVQDVHKLLAKVSQSRDSDDVVAAPSHIQHRSKRPDSWRKVAAIAESQPRSPAQDSSGGQPMIPTCNAVGDDCSIFGSTGKCHQTPRGDIRCIPPSGCDGKSDNDPCDLPKGDQGVCKQNPDTQAWFCIPSSAVFQGGRGGGGSQGQGGGMRGGMNGQPGGMNGMNGRPGGMNGMNGQRGGSPGQRSGPAGPGSNGDAGGQGLRGSNSQMPGGGPPTGTSFGGQGQGQGQGSSGLAGGQAGRWNNRGPNSAGSNGMSRSGAGDGSQMQGPNGGGRSQFQFQGGANNRGSFQSQAHYR